MDLQMGQVVKDGLLLLIYKPSFSVVILSYGGAWELAQRAD
jgi:hypothetical protein